MTNIVVVFYKMDDAKNIKNILIKYGFHVSAICSTGAQAIAAVEELSDGVVVSGAKFMDMTASELRYMLSAEFEMLLVSSYQNISECTCDGIVGLTMPLKVHELVNSLNMIIQGIERRRRKRHEQPRVRNEEEIAVISEAKALLMNRNRMSEEEAHRYIQKNSMDSGTSKVETARMILSLMA